MAAGRIGPVHAGFGRWFRALVCVGIIGVLVWQLLDSLEREAVRLQEQVALLTLNQLRSALVVRGAEIKLKHGGDYRSWQGKNPFEWLDGGPARYVGICPQEGAAPGRWCFMPDEGSDGETGRIMFRPGQPITIGERQGNRQTPLYWEVGVEFTDRNGNGRLDASDRQTGLKLVPVGTD